MLFSKGFRLLKLRTLTRAFFILTIAFSFFNVWNLQVVSAACTVNGTVYLDYNNNGLQDALEPGEAGITVNAYDATGLLATATTIASNTAATNGTYQLPLAGAPDEQVRIEFTNIPSYLFSGRFGAANASTTTVTFVDCSGSANINGINLALSEPSAYCPMNYDPALATACYSQDNQKDPTVANNAVLVAFPNSSNGAPTTDGGTGVKWDLATASEIGTTWGEAYQRSTDSIYAAAFMKRFTGLGPYGTGAIYKITNVSQHALGGAALFVNLDTLGINTGPDPHPAGSPACNPAPPAGCWQVDTGAFDAVGKSALGGMEMSADDKTLYVINLFRPGGAPSELLELPITAAGVPPAAGAIRKHPLSTATLPGTSGSATGCPGGNADLWPFAVGVHRGRIYVGSVCTAESTQNVNDLRAYVHSIDPLNPGLGFRLEVTFPLNYPRRCAIKAPGCAANEAADWQPWATTWPAPTPAQLEIHPEPWLTDIVFDNDNMVLGFRDRMGDRDGSLRPGPNDPVGVVADLAVGIPAGDILRACFDATTSSYALEVNGSCGGVNSGHTAANDGQGPANFTLPLGPGNLGSEFYFQDNNDIVHPGAVTNTHDETTIGGLADIPGFDRVASTSYDPLSPGDIPGDDGLYDSGVIWFNNANGARPQGYRLVNDPAPGVGANNGLGKSNGLGDLEAICGPQPLEIGNRVWEDLDRNGIQDPGEKAISGVIVNLYTDLNGDNKIDLATEKIATTTTDANGEYYFNETNVFPGLIGAKAGINFDDINGNGVADQPIEPVGLLPQRKYIVALNDPANYGAGAPLDNYYLTPDLRTTTLGDGNDPMRDSNGVDPQPAALVSVTNFPQTTLTTGDFGDNDHTFDFGFSRIVPPIATPTPIPTTPPQGVTSGTGFTLSKSVDNPFAGPGTIVTWTLTIANPNSLPATNVDVTDDVPNELEIIPPVTTDSATGNVTVTGQHVEFTQGVLNPNETVHVVIKTRVKGSNTPPFIIVNTANGGCCGAFIVSPPAQAQVVSARRLPATGDSWLAQFRIPLLLVSLSLILIFVVRFVERLMRRRRE